MRKLTYIFIVTTLFVGLQACGSGSSSTGPEVNNEVPAIPDIEAKVQVDLSYFEDKSKSRVGSVKAVANKVLEKSGPSNYTVAAHIATGYRAGLTVLMGTYTGFFPESTTDAEFKSGMWVWNYGNAYGGASWSRKLTAEDVGSSIKWTLFYSVNDGGGFSIKDYKIIVGTTAKDESAGSWTFNAREAANSEQETPRLKTEWHYESDTQRTITTKLFGGNGKIASSIRYEENGAEHTIILDDDGAGESETVYWNTNTKEGYHINLDGVKKCWDSSFANVSC